jgi:N-(2-amino-2-carboxyethyl)-L-glutamate synthase
MIIAPERLANRSPERSPARESVSRCPPAGGILSTIGNTPLVGLTRLFADAPYRVFAKLEGFNPGGSIKDRASYNILKNALESGIIQPGATVIESSSGNMGIGLAMACSMLRLKFICVVDPKTTKQNIEILKAYGAAVDLVSEPDPATGEYLEARLNRVRTLAQSIRNSFWTDQYSSIFNALAHYQTMQEIVQALDGEPDFLFLATSTCGTLRGCADYVHEHKLHTRVFAVDAVGSVIFGQASRRRLIPGHGASRRPALFQPDLAERCIHVTDLDCVVGCRRLLKQEAILAGGSSGAVITAIHKVSKELPAGSTCAAIMADRGERYLDTIFSDAWVSTHFGDVAHLWED